jgi:tRNA(fMet)-specific endonuclease VapC
MDAKIKKKIFEAFDSDEDICITIINIYEVLRGFRWRANKKKESMFNDFLRYLDVCRLDDKAIDIASSIYADLRKSGKTIEDTDILIAAITIRNDGVLVSNNTRHYEGIERLKMVNWV